MKNNATMCRLGNYIREVDVRNSELAVTNLKGLSIEKIFIESIANTIGTDLRPYKVVKSRQFAYVPVTSRNGDKITVALYDGDEDCIISQAYTAFEVIDEAQLLPEYLMMWFRRSEFDRYARFHSHGSAREIFDWEEMCNVMLPVPPIDEQREIVARHKAIERKIATNRSLIASLEDTARAIYRKMFVDGIDTENLPDGWRMGTLGEIATFSYGKMPNPDKIVEKGYPVYSGYSVTKYYSEYSNENRTLIIIARGDAGSGEIKMSPPKCYVSNLAIAINPNEENYKWYLYYHLSRQDTSTLRTGSAQAQVTINSIAPFEIIIPYHGLVKEFSQYVVPIQKHIDLLHQENRLLRNIQNMTL